MRDGLNQEEKRGFTIALRVLSRKPRTKREVADALKKKEIGGATIHKIISLCEDLGYLDDQEYASLFALSRAVDNLWGRGKIKAELIKKGISREMIDRALQRLTEETNEEELLEKAMKKKIASMKGVTMKRDIERLYRYLVQRGFSGAVIIAAMKNMNLSIPYED